MFKFLHLFLFVCFVFAGFSNAYAQQAVEQLKKPMPEFESMADAEFLAGSEQYRETPFGDASLAYDLRLPKGWKKATDSGRGGFSVDKKVLGEVMRYFGPVRSGFRSYFSVQVQGLEYQLTAEQWFILHILENGYNLQGIDVQSAKRVEAVYIRVERDTTYVVRSVAQINGDRVIFAQYVLPVEHWHTEKFMAEKILSSFTPRKLDDSFVEDMVPYQFLDIAAMQYPVSWELQASPVRSIDRMHIDLFNISKRKTKRDVKILDGKISVHLVSHYVVEDLEKEIDKFSADMQKNGLVLHDMIEEPEDFIFDDTIDFAQTQVFKAVDEKDQVQDYELWFTIMAAGDYYYFLTLLTPERNADYSKWARNTQTFRLVNGLVKPIGEDIYDE